MRTNEPLLADAVDFDPSDPAWPSCLADLPDPPARLRVAGLVPFLDRAVAIVGTRRATAEGLAIAQRLGCELARAGFVVISGGAEGIDAAAHEGALAGAGLGVAVLASGLGRPFPRKHLPLFVRIASAGAVITEADDHDDPRGHLFLARNRLIAALARAVIVVQAPKRSGALSTAAHARRMARPTFAVPWSIDDPHGEGCFALLASGARACRDAGDVIHALTGDRPPLAPRRRVERDGLDDEQRAVLTALCKRASYVDDLVRATGLSPARVQTSLTGLMLLGLAAPDEKGAFRLQG